MNRKTILGTVFVLLLMFGVLFYYTQSQGFSITDQAVYIPMYWTAECVERTESGNTYVLDEDVPNEGSFYECSTSGKGVNTYIPESAGASCVFKFEDVSSLFGGFDVYDCPADAKEDNLDNSCNKIDENNKYIYEIDSSRKMYLNPYDLFGSGGSLRLEAELPSYGLRVEQADGFVEQTTTNCFISSAEQVTDDNVHTINADNSIVVQPNSPINLITTKVLAKSSHLINKDSVEGGDLIYVTRPNYYRVVKEADDGTKYVAGNEKYNSNIECVPLTVGCSQDAVLSDFDEQYCDESFGGSSDYLPLLGDDSRYCRYDCDLQSNTLVPTSDCITVPTECPDSEPVWDASTGECVRVEDTTEDEVAQFDPFYIYLAMGVMLALIIMLVVALGRKK